MRRRLRDSVVVITGASSGIGRAAAHQFAAKGATVVLAARSESSLREVERECVERGGRALVVPTDVTKDSEVEALAKRAVDTFGRIDVWVNNAAVTMFGRFEESPMDDYEQVLRTNLFGYIYGARAVLPYFREQGEGVLINNASLVGEIAQPYTSAYGVSKFGIRGLTEGLRMELLDAPNIHACTVLPASIDTPLFQHAANFTGREVKAMDPVYPPEQVAAAIVSLAKRPRREKVVGAAGRMMLLQNRLMPGLAERAMAKQVEHNHLKNSARGPTHGNLHSPMAESVRGGWMQSGRPGNRLTRLFQLVLLAAIPAGIYYLWRRRSARHGISGRLPALRGQAALASLPLLSWFGGRRRSRLEQLKRSGWLPQRIAGRRTGGTRSQVSRLPSLPFMGRSTMPSRRQLRKLGKRAPDRKAMLQYASTLGMSKRQARKLAKQVPDAAQLRQLAQQAPDKAQLRKLAKQVPAGKAQLRQLRGQVPSLDASRAMVEQQASATRRRAERMLKELPDASAVPMLSQQRRGFISHLWR